MNHHFWYQKWESKQIGFHQAHPHELLVRYWPTLKLKEANRVFLPLCGKTLDIHWMLSQGFEVVGAELSEIAIIELFDELGVEPKIIQLDELKLYQAQSISIYVGDIFKLDQETLGRVDAVYDRAALVALPDEMRFDYARHLMDISDCAFQLLITFDYDQTMISGPPFSIPESLVSTYYGRGYTIQLLETIAVPGGLKGQVAAQEVAWLLKKE